MSTQWKRSKMGERDRTACLVRAGDTLCQIVESLVSESTRMLWGHQKSQRIYVEE